MKLNRRHWFLFGSLVCAATVFFGCGKGERSESSSPTDAKAQIYKFLTKKTGQKQFKPSINLDLPQQMATLRSNVNLLEQNAGALRNSLLTEKRAATEQELQRAGESIAAMRKEIAQKENELSRQENTYIRAVREQISGVRNYETLYRLIGEELTAADRLLAEPDISRRRMGLSFAKEACSHANSDPEDAWLAARICEAYFWPNLDLADSTPGSRERALDLLETCRRVFFVTLETNNVLKNYHLLMSNAPNAKAADLFRVQLADWMEEKGKVQHASEVLNEVRDPEILTAHQERIVRVRERLAARQ